MLRKRIKQEQQGETASSNIRILPSGFHLVAGILLGFLPTIDLSANATAAKRQQCDGDATAMRRRCETKENQWGWEQKRQNWKCVGMRNRKRAIASRHSISSDIFPDDKIGNPQNHKLEIFKPEIDNNSNDNNKKKSTKNPPLKKIHLKNHHKND